MEPRKGASEGKAVVGFVYDVIDDGFEVFQ
jgi:hypothetical protein